MKKFLFIILVIIILVGGIFIVSQKITRQENEPGEIIIVSTLFPLYDFAKEIGGDKVSVNLLLPPGLEPHSFEPKPSDIIKINQANIFLYTGDLMEPWAQDIIKGINKSVKVVDSSFGIKIIEGVEHEHEHGDEAEAEHEHGDEAEHEHEHGDEAEVEQGHHLDPHIWLDFDNTKAMARTIARALEEIDPENSNYYQENLERYISKLSLLDNSYQVRLASCESREIIYGGHYAFGYLAKRYNLNYQAAQGFAPNSEPSANDLIYLIKEIKANNIKYVFYEELLSPKIAETLARETNTKLLLLNAAHNLSREDYYTGETFISIMERNLENLSIGLNCKSKQDVGNN